ncbi:heavy metal translocating P-type ATPase metal-binding domain-containing protein [Sapientia aquatica]|uniref:Putative metal-binding domain-containing protein n=1 Tax=Sapientia aquatica TaxID=1549640 RepID=A0A4R5W5S2_9BURK|nr:heavy metal translocating P-type ATPase metal-binding domain-containing protein [Sapientia aquatica]TDK68417.1 hypothetical protein E2I14_02420 [Sapientia aquatica]
MGIRQFFNRLQQTTKQESVACYHCGEQVSLRRVVRADFNGASRELCCHGCAAVLMMIETNGLIDVYLSNKSPVKPVS